MLRIAIVACTAGIRSFCRSMSSRGSRYNQDFRSMFAIAPGTIMLLLVVIPAMLTALGVVREKEMGSITNVYASSAMVSEYLIGKQLPYVAVGFVSFVTLVALTAGLFGIVPKGSV